MKTPLPPIIIGIILTLSGSAWTVSLYHAIKPEPEGKGPILEVNLAVQDDRRTMSMTPAGMTYTLYLLLTNSAAKPGIPEIGPETTRTFGGLLHIRVTSAGGETLLNLEVPRTDLPLPEPASFALYALDTLAIDQPYVDLMVTAHTLKADSSFATVSAEVTLIPPLQNRDPGSLIASYGQLVFAMFLTLLGLSMIIVGVIVHRASSRHQQAVL